MVKAIEKVLTFFVVLILILLLIQLLGGFIANSVEPAGSQVGRILQNMWDGIQNIAHTGSRS
jgi:hypothetical protein